MGLVREPKGVDFVVGPSTLTKKDKEKMSEIIALYKLTGKVPPKPEKTKLQNNSSKRLKAKRSSVKNE